jgi:hypothetical protein
MPTNCHQDPSSGDEGDYNLPLHIGAIFIIFAAASIGTIIPVRTRNNSYVISYWGFI